MHFDTTNIEKHLNFKGIFKFKWFRKLFYCSRDLHIYTKHPDHHRESGHFYCMDCYHDKSKRHDMGINYGRRRP